MIENREALLAGGNVAAREALLAIVEGALDAVQPARLVPEAVKLDGDRLVVDGRAYDLDGAGDVYVVGAGKGSLATVRALCGVLGDRVTDGIVVEKRGQGGEIEGADVAVVEAGHPIPDEAGREAAERVLELAAAAGTDDLVFACITGGASALLPAPADGIALADLARLTELLLSAGAPIEDVNAVRKHVSKLKGGRLARQVHPARTVTLVVVDEVGGEPWGPTVPDETTFADAVRALEKRDLRGRAPDSIEAHLREGLEHPERETPTAEAFCDLRTQTVVLADAATVCEAACARAGALGYEPLLLSTMIEGESREAGTCLAGIAREAAASGRPVAPPCALVSGGETTVDVTAPGDAGGTGDGGPNQEFALGVALAIAGRSNLAAVAVDTDGTDGSTGFAGGVVDGHTVERAAGRGVDVFERLRRHDAAGVLRELDDAVRTGATGTNVMDLRVLLVQRG